MTRGSVQIAEEARQVARYMFELLTLLNEVRRQLNSPPDREQHFPPAFSRN